MKKIVALALTVVMVLGLLAGCEKPMDAQTLAQKVDEAVAAQSSMSGKMGMDMDISTGITGMTLDMGVAADVEYKAAMDGSKMFMGMDMDMEIMGETQAVEMDVYMSMADGKALSYTYSGLDDTWVKQETEIANVEELQSNTMKLAELPAESLVLAEEKETLGEQECYVLTVTATGEQVMSTMGSAMDMMDEETRTMLEGIDWSGISGTMVYHINAETFLPVRNTIEIIGLGEAMNSIISGVMTEMLGMQGLEEMEITVDIPTVKVEMTELVYGDVEIPDVPQEGIDAAALNPDQGDGSYILRSGEDAVRIVLPEGYEGMVVDSMTLAMYNADYTVSAMYAYVEEVSSEDMKLSIEEEIGYYQLDESYVSHAYGEFNGFTTVILRLADGSAAYYAWKDTANGVFYALVEAYAPIDTPDVFLECVSEVEG